MYNLDNIFFCTWRRLDCRLKSDINLIRTFSRYFYASGDYTAQKMKFSIKDFFSKCDQISSFLRIWSHLLKKSLMKNFIFCAVLNEESELV